MSNKMLRGFADLSYFPISVDTATTYTVGTRAPLAGAQSLSPSDKRATYEIQADDGIYESGSEWTGTEMTITVAEMGVSDLAALCGGTYNSSDSTMTETLSQIAPTVALTFSALRADGGKRLYQYYCCRLTDYKAELATKGSNGSGAVYKLTFACAGRACDGKVRVTKDVAAGDGTTWLTTVASVAPGVGGR